MNRENHELGGADGIFWWRPAAWLRVTGEDAFTFLQGQFTNDLRESEMGAAVYGLWLNHKGRVLADGFVLRGNGGEFWVGSYFSAAVAIRERLESFIVADDVTVEDSTAEWRAVSILGEAPPVMNGVLQFHGRRSAAPNAEWIFRAEDELAVREQLARRREIDAAEMERSRIAAAIPAVPTDIGPGELPNEGGLETAAISYTKGCYLGQEVMARLKTMGRVRRRLRRVIGAGSVPEVGTELSQDGKRVGALRTAVPLLPQRATKKSDAGFIGFALVSLLNLRAEAPLDLATGGTVMLEEAP